jgi:hypothetical protein
MVFGKNVIHRIVNVKIYSCDYWSYMLTIVVFMSCKIVVVVFMGGREGF